LNTELLASLNAAFVQAQRDPAIKVVVLTGAGKGFCAGADLKELKDLDPKDAKAFAKRGQAAFDLLQGLGKPSIALIHGFALGGGCELAMAATLRIASPTASLGQPEIKLGIIPGFGGTQRLTRLVGLGRALELCLTGRLIEAEHFAVCANTQDKIEGVAAFLEKRLPHFSGS
jgi:enoyl-CoA hydratase